MSLRAPAQPVRFPLPTAGPCFECGADEPVDLFRQDGCTGAIYLCRPCIESLSKHYAGHAYQFKPVFKENL